MIKTHPFRGKIRSIEEIAEMIGKTPVQVEAYIRSGNEIPVPAALKRESLCAPFSPMKPHPSSSKSTRISVFVDGVRYESIDACAKVFGCSHKKVKGAKKYASAMGRGITSDDLTGKRRSPSKPNNRREITIDGRVFPSLQAAANHFGVTEKTIRNRHYKVKK